MHVLLEEFKEIYLHAKMSLSTFKQYRPEHIVLAFFTKFRQCLCEKYENSVLLMNVVNCHVSDDRKAKSVDELVNHTLCDNLLIVCVLNVVSRDLFTK